MVREMDCEDWDDGECIYIDIQRVCVQEEG